MMRTTGGLALSATSTRSRSRSRARFKASGKGRIPSCSPSRSMTRTSRALIRSLIRGSSAGGAMTDHSSSARPFETSAVLHFSGCGHRGGRPTHPAVAEGGAVGSLDVLGAWAPAKKPRRRARQGRDPLVRPGQLTRFPGGGKPRFVVVRALPYQPPSDANHPRGDRRPSLTQGGLAAYPRVSSRWPTLRRHHRLIGHPLGSHHHAQPLDAGRRT